MLFESPYNTIAQDDGFVRFTRAATLYPTLEALEEEAKQLQATFPPERRAALHCLRDLRDARGNNDPAFEAVLKTTRLQVFKGWARLAALMKTPTGTLHCRRMFDEQGIEALVTTDEQEAIAFLQAE